MRGRLALAVLISIAIVVQTSFAVIYKTDVSSIEHLDSHQSDKESRSLDTIFIGNRAKGDSRTDATSSSQEEGSLSLESDYASLVNYSDVLVVRNLNSPTSTELADHLITLRNIPTINVCNITTSTSETVNRATFQTEIRTPVEDCIVNNGLLGTINHIVTTKGIPLRVSEVDTSDDDWSQPFTIDRASVDSELALILGPYQGFIGATGYFNNPYYSDYVDFSYSSYGIFLVSRITGYNTTQAKALLDKVPYAVGKKGTFVFDVDPNRDSSPGYKVGNDWMRAANTTLTSRGFDVIMDETSAFLTNNVNVSGYTSWGSNDASYSAGVNSNYGFETDANVDKIPDNWFVESDPGNDQIDRNDTDKRYGSWSVRINRSYSNTNYSAISQNVTIKPDTRYYLVGSANISTVSSEMGAHLRIRAYNDTNQLVWEKNGSARTGTTTDWVSLSQLLYEPIDGVTNITVSAQLSQSSGEAYFDNVRLIEIKPHNSWLPGALAETYVSTGGRSFNYPTAYGQSLVADLILDGVTGVKGYVYEPYLSACAHPSILFDTYTQGYFAAESYYMASAFLGWMDTVVVDPKLAPYRPSIIPDLAISPGDISFSEYMPTAEDIVNIYANISNIGNFRAGDIVVSYYDGDPLGGGTLIGSSMLNVEAQGQNITSFSWNTTGFSGMIDVYVFVDAPDLVYELDENNNIAFAQITILDRGTMVPELNDIRDDPDPQENGGFVNITGNITDDVWLDQVFINITYPDSTSINVSMVKGTANEWFHNDTYWDLGDYTYIVWANDNIENWNRSSLGVFTIQDTDGPWLNNLSALPDPQIVDGNVNITVNITDDVGVGGVWVNITFPDSYWTNVTMVYFTGNEWFINASFHLPGEYSFSVWAYDSSNNWASKSSAFTIIDVTLPSITGVNASPDPQEVGGYVNVTVNVTDNVAVYEVWIDIIGVGNFSMSYDVSSGLYFYNYSYLYPKSYAFTIWANDTSDNWNSTASSFQIVDTQAPIISDVTENPNPQEAGGYVNITANITDFVGVSEVWINIVGVGNYTMSYDSVLGLYYYNRTYYLPNTYAYTIWANDTSNNWNSTSSSFQIVDTQAPIINDLTANPNPQEVEGYVNITVNVTDLVGVDQVWANIFGVGNFSMDFDSVSGLYFFNASYSVTDTYSYTIWAGDIAGNWNLVSSSFQVVDTQPPEITNVTENPDPQEVNSYVNITAMVTDIVGVTGVWINVVDTSNYTMKYDPLSGLYFCNESYSNVNTYSFTIWAKDPTGNWNSTSSSFTIQDTIPPVSRPGNNVNVTEGTEVTFNGSTSYDNTGTIVNYTWTITKDGQVIATLYGISPSFTFDALGNYTVALVVMDAAGLTNQESINVTVTEVDIPPPDGETPEDTLWIIILAIIAVLVTVIIIIFIIWRKKKEPEEASPGSNESHPD